MKTMPQSESLVKDMLQLLEGSRGGFGQGRVYLRAVLLAFPLGLAIHLLIVYRGRAWGKIAGLLVAYALVVSTWNEQTHTSTGEPSDRWAWPGSQIVRIVMKWPADILTP